MAESRRITGPHLLLSEPGAAIELTTEDPDAVVALARHGAERLGWTVQTAIRHHAGGATVAISAPPDQLYTACYLLDWAVDQETWDAVVESQTEEENPALVTLLQSGGAVFFDDDDGFTAGMGRYSQTWPLSALNPGPPISTTCTVEASSATADPERNTGVTTVKSNRWLKPSQT